jgi:hypothetical protein
MSESIISETSIKVFMLHIMELWFFQRSHGRLYVDLTMRHFCYHVLIIFIGKRGSNF